MADVLTKNSGTEEKKDTGTAGSEIANFPTLSETRTGMAVLTDSIGFSRSRVGIIGENVAELHQQSRLVEWGVITAEIGKSDPTVILASLANLGFAWRDVARLIGVTVPAIQKWRRGGNCTGINRRNLAQLLAACQMIQSHYSVEEIGSWFEMPIYPGVPVTPLDLYEQHQQILLFEYAGNSLGLEEILNRYESNWREKYQSRYEVFTDVDGDFSIRPIAK